MENNTHEHNEKCCNNFCCGSWHKYHILRWLLGIVILFAIFFLGLKVGELKSFFFNDQCGFGGKHNLMGKRVEYFDRYSPPMMGGNRLFLNQNSGTGNLPPMMYFQQFPTATAPQK